MTRVSSALVLVGIVFVAAVGIDSGHAAESKAITEVGDDLLGWLTRSRWSRHSPEQPATPTLSDISHHSVMVSWTAPESGVFEIVGYDVQYRDTDAAGFEDWGHDGVATRATITGLAEVTEYEVRVRAVSEVSDGDWSAAATGTTLLAPPVFVEGDSTDREVDENTVAGEPIGEPVRATVPDGALRYGLAGESADAFIVDPSSGQLRTRTGVDYDYESQPSYAVEVEASDARRGTARILVRISVLDVSEPPGQPDEPAVSSSGSTGLWVTWSAPTNTGPPISGYDVEYRRRGTEAYLDAGHEGTGTRATITGLLSDTLYESHVRAKNDEGIGEWSDTGHGRTSGGGEPPHSPLPSPPGSPPPESPRTAPVDQNAFDALFVGNYLSTPEYFIEFGSVGRFRENSGHLGDYTYESTGSNTGTLVQTYDDTSMYGGSCTNNLTFASTSAGTSSHTCANGRSEAGAWRRDTVDYGSFNIEVVWESSRQTSADNALQAAATKWESVITADIGLVYISSSTEFGVVDDLRVRVRIRSIDGPSGTLARAGPWWVRTSSGLPAVSTITLDEDDIGSLPPAAMRIVAEHELAHALGFGTIWSSQGLWSSPSAGSDPNSPLPDMHFTGAKAIKAFDAAGGTSYAGAKVPVENDPDAGGVGAHWRVSVFGYGELMVPAIRSGGPALPMSAITVQSMADLGYTVNASAADGYTLPSSNSASMRALTSGETLQGLIPFNCIVTRPVPTDGVTLIELNSAPLQ